MHQKLLVSLIILVTIILYSCSEGSIECPDLSGRFDSESYIDDRRPGKLTYNIPRPELFHFEWSNGKSTRTITDLEPGEYCVTITVQENEACSTTECFTIEVADPPAFVLEEEDITRVLLLGNSMTFFFEMPDLLTDILTAAEVNDSIHVHCASNGGWSWEDHVNSTLTLETIRSEQWDYVVLQELSVLSTLSGEEAQMYSYQYAETLANEVRDNREDTEILIYLRPGIEFINADLCNMNALYCKHETILDALRNHAVKSGELLECGVSPCAMMWQLMMDQGIGGLFDQDGGHPSARGAYVTAATLFTSITGKRLNIEKLEELYFNQTEMNALVETINASVFENNPDWRTYKPK